MKLEFHKNIVGFLFDKLDTFFTMKLTKLKEAQIILPRKLYENDLKNTCLSCYLKGHKFFISAEAVHKQLTFTNITAVISMNSLNGFK